MRRYPRIYDINLNRIGELRTAKISDLKKKQTPFSTVTVTVPVKDIGSFGYRQFVELFDAAGVRIDIFRVTGIPDKRYAPSGMVKLTCDHALCTLKDGIVPGYHQFGGTTQNLRSAIEAVLAFQDDRHWVLDRCEYDTYFEYGICDEKPYTALTMLLEPLEDPIIVTDTSTYPWKLSILKMTDEDASELRFSRNMEAITEIIQEADFATRLYPRGYGEGVNQLTIRDVNGGVEYIEAPQAVRDLWGTVSLPYIDTTITDAATLKAKAEVALAICQNPHVSYEVSAVDLSMLTGEPMDSFYEGRMVRMIYKDYGIIVRTRVTEIHQPDPIGKPGEVKLTLSSQPTSVATIIADLARKSKINDTYGQGSTFIYADSFEQNADISTPAEGDIYIPETMIHVNAVMLKVTLSNYRADSKGAAGGGSVVQTTAVGGGGIQTSEAGGGGTRTSESGGGGTVSVPAQTVSTGIINSGHPVDEEGGTSNSTGLPTDLLGSRVTKTESYSATVSAGADISTSSAQFNGLTRTNTDSGGDGNTGTSEPETGSAGGDISTSSAQFDGSTRTSTDSDGDGSTGSSAPGTGSAGGDISTSSAQFGGSTRTSTDSSSPDTNSAGSHSHDVNSHTHSFSGSDSQGIGHNHSISSGASATGGIYSGYTKVEISISGTTGSRSPGTDSDGSHSHTVNSHSHGMAHYHTLSTSHSHTVNSHSHSIPAHSHGMAHYHTLSTSHSHTVNSHSHSVESHTHGMAHYHTLSTSHSHDVSHSHDFDHVHSMPHLHSIAHEHTIPALSLSLEAHSHSVYIPEHSHDISIPDHQHDIEIEDHVHDIVYGIYKGPTTDAFVVKIDGMAIPSSAFENGEGDIAPYLSTDDQGKIRRGVFHTLTITPVAKTGNENGLCRIRASWSAQVFISSLTGRQY